MYSLSEGDGDLFRIKLNEDMKPDPVVLVSGNVYDSKTNKALGADIVYELLSDGSAVGSASTNAQTGEYQIVLHYGQQYGFSASAKGYVAVSENLDLTTVAEYKEVKRDLYLTPIEVGQKVRLNNIFFDVGATTLRPQSFPELNRVADMLRENPNLIIEIGGHTDSDGSDAYNTTLSKGRAEAVQAYLLKRASLTEQRVNARGYGESVPVVPNNSDANKQQNRRVEIKIVKN